MECKNCGGNITGVHEKCTSCGKEMHSECSFQCVKCGVPLCDECALKQKYKCNSCYTVQVYSMPFISSTMFESYLKCPYSFKQEHILNTLTDEQKENKWSALGTLLHSLFDKYSLLDREILVKQETVEELDFEFCTKFNVLRDDLFVDEFEKNQYMSQGTSTISVWWNTERYKPVPLYTEQQHFITLPGIDTPVRVTIDRINGVVDNPADWEVEDYKTGKVYTASMLRENMQLPTYAMAIREVYGALPKLMRLRFPQHPNKDGIEQTRVFERITDDVYVCNVRGGGTYSISLSERLKQMQDIYNNIKRGSFPFNTSNTHFCENFCRIGTSGQCGGLETAWKSVSNKY